MPVRKRETPCWTETKMASKSPASNLDRDSLLGQKSHKATRNANHRDQKSKRRQKPRNNTPLNKAKLRKEHLDL